MMKELRGGDEGRGDGVLSFSTSLVPTSTVHCRSSVDVRSLEETAGWST